MRNPIIECMEYNFRDIEQRWQRWWREKNVYKVENASSRPKYYVLDMFPYPSGAGLHVGHPLGYIASDIFARFKRLKGFNVLHPMGFDAFGLPAEQYAIEHGIHPAVATEDNINNFRRQLDNIGFCFDWSREVRTCDPKYYKWTQWIFLQIFDSWFNRREQKAERIETLKKIFDDEGNTQHQFPNEKYQLSSGDAKFTAEQWKSFDDKLKEEVLMQYRLAYLAYTEVNWCEALGTVLANDEVINGVSYRGGYPVIKRKMRQWSLRITEYAERLLNGLEEIDFSESMKDIQRNWIGKSFGAEIDFRIEAPSRPSPEGKEGQHTEPRYRTARRSLYNITKALAEEKRKKPTHEEMMMWARLRNNQIGFHIRRQHIIDSYLVDFACLDKLATIEIDGGYHSDPETKKYDAERTQFLKEQGFTELRYTNEEVRSDIEKVIADIVQKLKDLPSVPKKTKVGQVLPIGEDLGGASIRVFTTRPDTIFGVDFMVLAPEHELVKEITAASHSEEIEKYLLYVQGRSEVERMAEVKKITGCFTGAYVIHPFSKKKIPIWISEYVLIGYGTGAIMGVPCGDERDHKFAKHFNIPITNIIGDYYNGEEANPTKDAILQNSDFLDGMVMRDAIEVVIRKLEEQGIGERKVNYKMRDAGWSRQRYWGEPFPVVFRDDIPYAMDEDALPLELPPLDNFRSAATGEGPLANVKDWVQINAHEKRDTNTMPTHAGAAWYFLRYMDPHNEKVFADKKNIDYWGQVDVYIGGAEHAVAHLLYSRLWVKILYDLGYLDFDEPFRKLINQGKITGDSRFVYRIRTKNMFVSAGLRDQYETDPLHVDVNIVDGLELDIKAFRKWKPDFADAEFILENGKYICGSAIEKMSKSYFNVINPDTVVEKYGADTFRMYEMFLGPLEASKPWDIKGIEGVFRFLKKFWRLFVDEEKGLQGLIVTDEPATQQELKILHKAIKKIEEDTERFSFNTGVSAFMIATNELTDLKCHKRSVLEPLLILLAPYSPHIAEELWHLLGYDSSVVDASFPKFEEKYVKESSKTYPVAINGKTRTELNIALDATQQQVEEIVLANDVVKKWMEGKQPKKVIYVKNKMVNVVV
jgi:leucyl-tRNA synthetase